MKVLVTGASGYIGSILVPKLLNLNHEIVAVDRYFFGDYLPNNKRLKKVRVDSRDLNNSHFKNVEAVIDLVAISNDPSGEFFQDATYEINYESRVKTAKLAKKNNVRRYILPSSCSIYGFQEEGHIAHEDSKTKPLTTYAKANEMAEKEILPLADDNFIVTVLRQSTVYGFSPRMRFDLAINGMTYGAWKNRKLPLMRDGKQWRPMIHIKDTCDAQIFMLSQDSSKINGEVFNTGSPENVYQLGNLSEIVAKTVGEDVEIEWYGDKDIRSYNVSFDKIEKLGFKAKYSAQDGVIEILDRLNDGSLDKTIKTITLDWYKKISYWHELIKEIEIDDLMINR